MTFVKRRLDFGRGSGLAPFALRLGGSLQVRAENLCITFADFAVRLTHAVPHNADGW